LANGKRICRSRTQSSVENIFSLVKGENTWESVTPAISPL
jgi:hypothetical protein